MHVSKDTREPPKDDSLDDLPPCKNCGCNFDEHMQDGEPPYMCPYEHQDQPLYGFFHGGDPRDFHPDYECSTPDEIAAHKEACQQANILEKARNMPCHSGWVRTHEFAAHILRAPFGLGITTYPPTCYEKPETAQ